MLLTIKKQRVFISFTLEDLKNPVTKESITQALINREDQKEEMEERCLFQNLEHENMSGV